MSEVYSSVKEVSYNSKLDVLSVYFEDPKEIMGLRTIISCGEGIEIITIEDTNTIAGVKVARLSSYLEEKELTEEEKQTMIETEGFTLDEFIEYMSEKAKDIDFSAGAIYIREADSLEIYFKDVRHYTYGATSTSEVDLYLDMKNNDIVGCRVWDISRIIERSSKNIKE
jgi:hypothetical protein